jgi:hypothetical protein
MKLESIVNIETPDAERITGAGALPVWRDMLHAIVGEGESGKTWLAAHTALAVAKQGRLVVVLDGEMSGPAWRRRLSAMSTDHELDGIHLVHYAEMTSEAAQAGIVIGACESLSRKTEMPVDLIIWDSALSLISRSARSENDNAEVSRVYDSLREIVRVTGAAGLVVDHTTRGSGTLVSRGATAKFNALDISYGMRLVDGDVPSQNAAWSSVVSVEKDRHGMLPGRPDREVVFNPLGNGQLDIGIVELGTATHRLSATNPVTVLVEKIGQLQPAPTSGNDAHRRIGGNRRMVLAAYKQWSETGTTGTDLKVGYRVPVTSTTGTGTGTKFGTGLHAVGEQT